MKIEKIAIPVSGFIGSVSGEVMRPAAMKFLYVFAHGAGAGMHHPFMVGLSRALAALEIGTLRYNFPYMERGSKRPDSPAVAEETVMRAIAVARKTFPSTPLLAGGKSFGGRMTSQALSKTPNPSVNGIVFTGFPLHPVGKPGTGRATHLTAVTQPILFLQGTRDALANIALIEEVSQHLSHATLKKFEGADHSFKAGKRDMIPALAQAISDWASGLDTRAVA